VREAFDSSSDVRERFARWHADPQATVHGWTDVWLHNDFGAWDLRDDLPYIRVPVLIIQGDQDNFGTMRQIEIAREECTCPAEALVLPGVRHVPYREAPEATLAATVAFCRKLLGGQRTGG